MSRGPESGVLRPPEHFIGYSNQLVSIYNDMLNATLNESDRNAINSDNNENLINRVADNILISASNIPSYETVISSRNPPGPTITITKKPEKNILTRFFMWIVHGICGDRIWRVGKTQNETK